MIKARLISISANESTLSPQQLRPSNGEARGRSALRLTGALAWVVDWGPAVHWASSLYARSQRGRHGLVRLASTMSALGSPVRAYDFLLKFLLVGDSDVGKGEILASLQDGAAESPYGHPAGESWG